MAGHLPRLGAMGRDSYRRARRAEPEEIPEIHVRDHGMSWIVVGLNEAG